MKKLLLMIAAVATLFTACNKDCGHDFIEKDYSKDIVGAWTCLKAGFAEALVFNADGSFVSIGVANGAYWEELDARWVLKNNKLTLSAGDYKSDVLLEIIPGKSLALVDANGTRNVFDYCANDLADEIVGMWVCTETPSAEENDMLIMTYNADGTTSFSGYFYEVDDFGANKEASYKVIGDLLIHKQPDIAIEYGLVQYTAMRIKYTPNATALGDIKTLQAYAIVGENHIETNTTWLRVKQSLNIANINYDYSNVYVTNVKGADKSFEFAGQTLNFSTLDGSAIDKFMKHILFNVSFASNKIVYNCYYNGKKESIDAPIVVEGNKMTIKMGANNSVYKDIEVYAFQDAKNSQLHMYMPTKSFEKFIANIAVVLMAKSGELNLNDAQAVSTIFNGVDDAIETINVSFIFKDPTRAL